MPTRHLLPPAPRRPAFSPQSAALYAAYWLPLVVVYIGVLTTMTGGQLSAVEVTLAALFHTFGPAMLGIAVWWLTGRVPVPMRLSVQFAALHLLFASLYVATWMGWELFVFGPLSPTRPAETTLWLYVLPWQAVIGYLMYAVVAGISYTVRGAFLVNDLAVTAATADRLRAEAELAALRAHLDPHFLFNTLHGVMQLLRDSPADAERALERLAELLRYVLRLDRARVRSVTLEEEWQFVQSYLWLEQMRLADRLRVVSSLDDDALACVVPPFCLQPLVENAIRHGLAPKPGGGTLRISAQTVEDRLEIVVADDGLGAPEPPGEASPGLGIPAVLRRVRGYYGAGRVQAEITTSTGTGFVVRMTMPAQPTDDGEDRL